MLLLKNFPIWSSFPQKIVSILLFPDKYNFQEPTQENFIPSTSKPVLLTSTPCWFENLSENTPSRFFWKKKLAKALTFSKPHFLGSQLNAIARLQLQS